MKRIISIPIVLSALALLCASCEKDPMARGSSPAIKLTVSGIANTKAAVNTLGTLQNDGFNISAYVTDDWKRDVVGGSEDISAGIYIDPGEYEGPYDESTYPTPAGHKLQDVLVTFDDSRDNESWRITGNDGANYAGHQYSWVSGVAMNFFAYAPVEPHGTRTISKADNSVDANYPFTYAAKVSTGKVTSSNCDDLLFAYTQHTATFDADQTSSKYGELISGSSDKFFLKFYHALAQIRFCLSTDDGTYTSTTKLVSIELLGPESATTPGSYTGIPSSGSCTFTGPSSFSWPATNLGAPAAYSQTFNNADFSSSTPTNWVAGTYSPTTGVTKNLYTCTGDVMFVIPQTLSECVVKITVNDGGTNSVITGKLPETVTGSGVVSWEAGKVYTYKIKAGKNGGLDLLPDGWFNGGGGITIN